MHPSNFILAAALATGAVAKPVDLFQSSYPTPQSSNSPKQSQSGSVTAWSTTGSGYASATSSTYLSASSRAPSESDSTANNQDLINNLELAATAVDRIALIPNDQDFVYDFLNPPPGDAITKGNGGQTVKADRKLFPALIGTGVSMTLGFISPCGINTPHVHPRSSQINIVVKNMLATEFTAENGARSIVNTLNEFEMTVFPQGAVHTEWNPTCEESIFVAGFASEDPGVQQSAQTFFGLQDEVIEATLGVGPNATFNGEDLDTFKHLIPDNVAQSIELCLQNCNIQKKLKRSLSEL